MNTQLYIFWPSLPEPYFLQGTEREKSSTDNNTHTFDIEYNLIRMTKRIPPFNHPPVAWKRHLEAFIYHQTVSPPVKEVLVM